MTAFKRKEGIGSAVHKWGMKGRVFTATSFMRSANHSGSNGMTSTDFGARRWGFESQLSHYELSSTEYLWASVSRNMEVNTSLSKEHSMTEGAQDYKSGILSFSCQASYWLAVHAGRTCLIPPSVSPLLYKEVTPHVLPVSQVGFEVKRYFRL